jgi:membrane-associated protein
MSLFLSQLLLWLQAYGYAALGLTLCLAAIGAPLPVDLLLLAAGAYSAVGDFNVLLLALAAICGSVCGDLLGYGIGRLWGSRLLDWLEHKPHLKLLSPHLVVQARKSFAHQGGWAIFLSRFLFSGVGGEINLLAGANPYPFRRFLLVDVSGETLGALLPLGLGLLFGASWEAVGDVLESTSLFILALLLVLLLGIALFRIGRRSRHQDQAMEHLQLLDLPLNQPKIYEGEKVGAGCT